MDLKSFRHVRLPLPPPPAHASGHAADWSNAKKDWLAVSPPDCEERLVEQCKKIKEGLKDKAAPWGVDLLLPQVGGSARKTNKDYTGGALFELLDIIIEEGASLFVSAVGVPPVAACEKLHAVRSPPPSRRRRHLRRSLTAAPALRAGGHPRGQAEPLRRGAIRRRVRPPHG